MARNGRVNLQRNFGESARFDTGSRCGSQSVGDRYDLICRTVGYLSCYHNGALLDAKAANNADLVSAEGIESTK